MATMPTFASTPRVGSVQITNATGTNPTAAAISGVAAGTRIREIRICSGPTTSPGTAAKIRVLLSDGVTDRIIDAFNWTASADTLQALVVFNNVILPSTSHSIKFSVATAVAAGATLDCVVFGEDLT